MDYSSPYQFENVTVLCKANVYFDGKVVSRSVVCADGQKKHWALFFRVRISLIPMLLSAWRLSRGPAE